MLRPDIELPDDQKCLKQGQFRKYVNDEFRMHLIILVTLVVIGILGLIEGLLLLAE